ncbi:MULTISPECIES: DUF799 domain-containing protein [Alteromonadaceae]|jgi:hypothetical protein|uniref:DUF799 domain-containing protein n=1 Tax=Brumicola blandensis TaxID=3075611 RepID=A0AAW8R306_9ALTE|nr:MULTISPECIES: DUF799 domain-containing protein [unclassified Alteromonas]MDT0583711.1 DUF799 domain-containing protein [Alteromonas sp. W409]MDT0629164.1 DUF799 domain-containing protein [Alteromonas sp. W364]
MKTLYLAIMVIGTAILSGCVSPPPAYDYSEFRLADPKSVVVLPPINNSQEVVAGYSVMSQVAAPISESGFYTFPIAIVNETFKNNGLTVANDVHAVPYQKLYEIFGADTALYMTIENYGTSYVIVSSDTVVTVSAKLVDLRSGAVLWQNAATASSAETRGNSGGGLIGMLVEAAVNQIIETVVDRGFDIAAIANARLLNAESYNGLLYGPRSPKYGQPVVSEKQK